MRRLSHLRASRLLALAATTAAVLCLSGCYYPYGAYAPGYYHYPAPVYAYHPGYYRPYY